jgi:mannan endo-1,4-beta-mannosidase
MNVRRVITALATSAIVLASVAVAACSAQGDPADMPASRGSPLAAHSSPSHDLSPLANFGRGTASILGVVTDDTVAEFEKASRLRVNLQARYLDWGNDLPLALLYSNASAGVATLIELEPYGVTLSAIANGRKDSYIRTLASEARSVKGKVYLAFAPEMNGNWYSWGGDPSLFVRAWRHFVSVFRSAKATNVSWVWIIHHVEKSAVAHLPSYFPGQSWVTWVGLDGYYEHPYDSFDYLFGQSLTEVRSFTTDPVLVTETAVGPLAGEVPVKIGNLFDSVKARRLLGLIWFDIKQDDPPVHQNWNLESRPAALKAFRADAKQVFKQLEG